MSASQGYLEAKRDREKIRNFHEKEDEKEKKGKKRKKEERELRESGCKPSVENRELRESGSWWGLGRENVRVRHAVGEIIKSSS
jgi:hypothetical protein